MLITETAAFAKSTGVGESTSAFKRNSIHAFIKSINAADGIAGRRLTAIDASVEVTSSNLNAEFQAACERFTKDNRVAAVIYDGVVYNETFNACLTKAGVPQFFMHNVSGSGIGDVSDLANNPGLIAANSVSLDRRLNSIFYKALGAGFLRSGSKLGIIVDECAYTQRAYERIVVPIVARAKVEAFREDVNCAQVASEQGELVSRLQAASLRFKTEGVDSVMFVSVFENGYVYYFAQGAETQGYRPQYLLYRPQADPQSMAVFPRAQLVAMRGFGGTPLVNVTHPPAPPAAQAQARKTCLSMAGSHGVKPADYVQQLAFFDACDAVLLLRRALTMSGGQGGTQSVVAALERIGTDFVSALVLKGATRFGPGRHDGTELTAVSAYESECECFTYITQGSPIT